MTSARMPRASASALTDARNSANDGRGGVASAGGVCADDATADDSSTTSPSVTSQRDGTRRVYHRCRACDLTSVLQESKTDVHADETTATPDAFCQGITHPRAAQRRC